MTARPRQPGDRGRPGQPSHTGQPGHPAYGVLRQVTPYASVLLAGNPSPMTLDGTNTWILRAGGVGEAIVVDPGPDEPGHLAAVARAGPVRTILLTHGHADHSAGARRLHELTGAPVRALDPAHRYGGAGLGEGDVVALGAVEVRVLATPGHSGDSLCFLAAGPGAAGAVLTGDTILGRGTTVVAHPDGRLADYLASLRRLAELGTVAVLPGHGPELPDVAAAAGHYLAHREQRLAQVRAALDELGPDATARQVVEHVYAGVDRAVWWAAELSVRAQLDYLRDPAG
jgi:glyoxylase-like metal-dependent hydrolase (beta-lactamase superfamily II)